jgi:hypothetical protein
MQIAPLSVYAASLQLGPLRINNSVNILLFPYNGRLHKLWPNHKEGYVFSEQSPDWDRQL